MLIPLHQLVGSLTTAINTLVGTMVVDLASYSLIKSKLDAIDWTYLSIQYGSTFEIVKVTSANTNGSITIQRGLAPTTAQSFPVGAEVKFIMGEQAVADLIIEHQLGNFNITGSGSVTVTQTGPTSFNIHSPVISLSGQDGVKITGSMAAGFVVSLQNPIPCCPGTE